MQPETADRWAGGLGLDRGRAGGATSGVVVDLVSTGPTLAPRLTVSRKGVMTRRIAAILYVVPGLGLAISTLAPSLPTRIGGGSYR